MDVIVGLTEEYCGELSCCTTELLRRISDKQLSCMDCKDTLVQTSVWDNCGTKGYTVKIVNSVNNDEEDNVDKS